MGEKCQDNHPRKNCTKWNHGTCNRGYNCTLRHAEHAEQRRENPPKNEQTKTKEKNMEKPITEYESKLEQIVEAVKEGFKSQNDFLSNTQKGINKERQNIPRNQAQQEQVRAQMQLHQAQPHPIKYAQNFPQLVLPNNPYQMNQVSLFNIQPDTFTQMNDIRQKLSNLTNVTNL